MRKKNIAIIGFGYVGRALYRFFCNREDIYNVIVYNYEHPELNEMVDNVPMACRDEVNRADFVVVCVPTPQSDDGSCDLSAIHQTFDWLIAPLVLIKSTVLPGTTKKMVTRVGQQVVFSPEYIGEGKYYTDWIKYPHPTDMRLHKFQIFGGDKDACAKIIGFFQPVMGPSVEYLITDSTTAEMVKYTFNNWAAMKVTFFNQIYDIATKIGVSFEELRGLTLKDSRIEPMHTLVFPDNRGFSGKCLPKDTHALVKFAEANGVDVPLLKTMNEVNEKYLKNNPS